MEVLPGALQMISGSDGNFDDKAVRNFINASKELRASAASHTVVSIIGPQSSGKSYLLNLLFGTKFQVMNAAMGRGQTTKGIWIARCIKPCMIIMDVEGSDGRERGEDVTFEKQSALFALTVSDVMLVNMWLHDIGREQGGSIPLLKLIFQERLKLDPHKTRLVVVIRDYDNETPVDKLKESVMTNIKAIWKSIRPRTRDVLLSEYIQLSIEVFPCKRDVKAFTEQCATLRKWFATGELAGIRQDKVTTSGFSFSAKQIWNTIRQNKQLNLPSHKVIVSTYVCNNIMEVKLDSLASNQDYTYLIGCSSASVEDFSKRLQSLLVNIFARYDEETSTCDQNVKDATQQKLVTKIISLLEPSCKIILGKLLAGIILESKSTISAALKKEECPHESVNSVISPHLYTFSKSCEGLHSQYKPLIDDQHQKLEKVLINFAETKANKIERRRRIVKVVETTAVVSLEVGLTAARVAVMGDPNAITDFLNWLNN